ncbi:MAG TPA: acyl-CoA dehydrogenase [Candidatus Binatia bacterium]|nr:acyl-CoA dehydrogenase [Candidatus Binatia bacterium]
MDFAYTAEQERFRAEVRTFLERALPAGWGTASYRPPREAAEIVAFDRAFQKKLYDAGYSGLSWPKEYGGRGASLVEQIIFMEETARAKAPLPVNLAGLTMAGPVLIKHGTEKQKARFLRPILTSDEIWCQGFSEPGAGSDLASLRTSAVLDGDDFLVNGQKVWTSWAHQADWCMLLVRTDPQAPKHKGITFLVVDMRSPGITVRPLRQISGDDDFNELFFDNLRVPRENVIGEVNRGWEIAITCLMHERATLTFQRQLQSRTAFADMLPHLRERAVGDAALRQKVAQLHLEGEIIRLTAYRGLTQQLRGRPPGPEGSIEKLFWSEMYQRQLEAMLETLGPYAQLMPDSPRAVDDGRWPHLFLYSRGRTIAAGTSEVQRNIIADRVLGLPRS